MMHVQDDMKNVEMVRLTTTNSEKIFQQLLNVIRVGQWVLPRSHHEEDSEDKKDD
jgi:hypothetical protein